MKKNAFLFNYSNVADSHAARLSESLVQTRELRPFTPTVLSKLSFNQLAFLDMMTLRFSKLQDVLGARIFPLILSILGEDAVSFSFIDKLNKLEKLGYLDEASWWMALREIRNQLAHDYPDNDEAICAHLSTLVIKASELLEFWQILKKKITMNPVLS